MKRLNSFPHIDGVLLVITGVLILIGTIMVFSSSVIMADIRWQAPYSFFTKQVIWVILGCGVMVFFAQYDYKNIQKYSRAILVVSVILLVVVLLIGTEKGGARRWLRLGFLSFEPSELAKLGIILSLADYFDRRKSQLKKISGILPAFLIIVVPVGLISLQPDLGIPIVIVTVGLLLMYAAGSGFMNVFGIFLVFIPFVIFEIARKPYRLERIKNFIASWGGIESASYQVNQAIMAFGSGGFWGRGLAESQMKLFYLPEPHTDFIFSVIGEELGFVGALMIICLFVLFAWRGWLISKNSQTFFGAILALGFTWLIVFQGFFNMGVATGILPAKGLPLPFVSFGGTSLLLNLASVGVLLNISKQSLRTHSLMVKH